MDENTARAMIDGLRDRRGGRRTGRRDRARLADLRRRRGAGMAAGGYTIRYGGLPTNVVGIMEFRDGKVVRERT